MQQTETDEFSQPAERFPAIRNSAPPESSAQHIQIAFPHFPAAKNGFTRRLTANAIQRRAPALKPAKPLAPPHPPTSHKNEDAKFRNNRK